MKNGIEYAILNIKRQKIIFKIFKAKVNSLLFAAMAQLLHEYSAKYKHLKNGGGKL